MTTLPWKYLINTFYSQTSDSMKRALMLTQDHVAKLTANEADADILAIKTNYLPLHNAFINTHNMLESKQGIYKGKTQTFEEMLNDLAKTEINVWRGVVFAVFPEGTANATAIFPRDRQPFQQDVYDERVESVEALSVTLATYTTHPTLVTLSGTVHAYYLTLSSARALQQTDEGSVETMRTNLKAAHKLMCDGLYRNLGLLMAKYYQTPLTVANYFDLSLLRETGVEDENIFGGPIAAATILNLNELIDGSGIETTPATVVRMKNNSPVGVDLTYFTANSPTESPGAGPQFTVSPGSSIDKTIGELSAGGFNYFNVQNPTGEEGSWEIELNP